MYGVSWNRKVESPLVMSDKEGCREIDASVSGVGSVVLSSKLDRDSEEGGDTGGDCPGESGKWLYRSSL